jgi:hypothetical protein
MFPAPTAVTVSKDMREHAKRAQPGPRLEVFYKRRVPHAYRAKRVSEVAVWRVLHAWNPVQRLT